MEVNNDLIFRAISCGMGFLIVLILGPLVIPLLRRLKMGQTEREELKSHQVKTGTPTMGGVMIILGMIIPGIIFAFKQPKAIPILLLVAGFGIIGFIDDYLKVAKKKSDGLLPRQKMALQIVVTAIFSCYMVFVSKIPLSMRVPFSGGYYLDIGFFAIPLLFFAVIGTVNGVNFTDGLDGLASCVTIVVTLFFIVSSFVLKGEIDLTLLAAVGALLGFLVFNHYPAKVFMGDTGSLALGGLVAGSAYMLQMPLYILIVGLVYLTEVLSVIIQVTYFKKTGGKRIFRMAPIHHHFELGGWSEVKTVFMFTLFTVLMAVIGYVAL